jgi:hypothetical protein
MQLTQRAAARDVQSLLHRLVRNHPPNIGLRNSELLSNFRWCDACLEGGANCILFADCQSYGRQFRPLTFGPRRWRFFTTPLLCHRNYISNCSSSWSLRCFIAADRSFGRICRGVIRPLPMGYHAASPRRGNRFGKPKDRFQSVEGRQPMPLSPQQDSAQVSAISLVGR